LFEVEVQGVGIALLLIRFPVLLVLEPQQTSLLIERKYLARPCFEFRVLMRVRKDTARLVHYLFVATFVREA
jgi:hypothetical protein